MSKRSKDGVVTASSGWLQREGGAAVRVTTRVDVQLPQPTRTVAHHAATGLSASLVLVFRLGVYGLGVALWSAVRVLECAAAIAVGAERMLGGSRQRLPLLYWKQPEQTGIERYHGPD